MANKDLLIVGNGMVGQKLVDELVKRDASADWTVTVVGEEPVPAYDRVALSSWFDGATGDDLNLCDLDALENAGIVFEFGRTIESIDRSSRTARLDDGSERPYDHLVLATGSYPFVPPVPGRDLPGCFVYRTLADLELIRTWAAGRRTGVVIGGGLLGLEAANALVNLGLETHVVEMADRLMPQQLDDPASAMLLRWIEALGVIPHLGYGTDEIEGSDLGVTALRPGEGDLLPTDIVVFSAGIRPRQELAEQAGLVLGERGGVVIDDELTTSDLAISAIGEVACHDGRIYGLVAPGYEMARALAQRLTGGSAVFRGADLSTKLKLLGVEMASFGTAMEDDDELVYADPIAKIHRRVSLRDGVVTGGVFVGDVSNFELFSAMASGEMSTDADKIGGLVLPAGVGSLVDIDLPDTAVLCTCNAVCRGDIKRAIDAGCHSIGAVKSETTAGTGCGGCIPGVTALLNEELVARGVEVSRALCEHFGASRQELFDLIRFHRHTTWAEVLAAHGSGRGCEICRPTVASILASLSNGYILGGDQASTQDTNDHVLANMQRNGTYSVVPRVPGGEITPDQLIALGEVAKDFSLYTKITGAQRIDLFGAQLHELPAIWQRVIDAGLESGHAYGKALRTVKSCVGTTWCRYGVQDSVAMAIRIERRYRGLRAPHKLKSAVSGCTRECAEAQSKDFGVIATETGWNLYLCGNGGRSPRHADLFATDLTDEQLITYLDRFLMFYIRTADRLERTAPWFEKLEGGLDYLRAVVIDDSLGICAELEADMGRHVENYRCEWTETLESSERLEHFIEFVNAPDQSWTPVWITERHQRVPAPNLDVTENLAEDQPVRQEQPL